MQLITQWYFAVIEQGDDINGIISDRTLVISNHQSTGDVPILMATFNAKPNVLPHVMWIMDRVFKFTNFGVVSLLHHDFFILSVSIYVFPFTVKKFTYKLHIPPAKYYCNILFQSNQKNFV